MQLRGTRLRGGTRAARTGVKRVPKALGTRPPTKAAPGRPHFEDMGQSVRLELQKLAEQASEALSDADAQRALF